MALVDSLQSAMVRANGDALVMHVGEKPYVVTEAGPIDLSTHGLNLQAMTGMLAQLLPADAHHALSEVGAVEHKLPSLGTDQFTVVAARGGDDIWIEIRRRRAKVAPPQPPEAPPTEPPAPQPVVVPSAEPVVAAKPEPVPPPKPEPVVVPSPEPVVAAKPEPVALPKPEPVVVPSPEPVVAAKPEPVALPEPEPVVVPSPEPVVAAKPEPVPPPRPEPVVVPDPEPVVAAKAVPASPPEPAVTPKPEPVVAPSFEPVVAARPQPVAMPEPEPTFVPSPEPVIVPKASPVLEPVPEPIATPRFEPVAAPRTAPVAVPEPEPSIAAVAEPRVAAFAASLVQPAAEAAPSAVVQARAQQPAIDGVTQGATPVSLPPAAPPAPVPPPAAAPEAGQSRPPQLAPPVVAERVDDVPAVPLTRTVRIEVPARAMAARQSAVERLLRLAAARGASALFLSSQSRPFIRVEGDVRPLEGEPPLGGADVEAALFEVIPEASRDGVRRGEPTEWIAEIADLGRIRCTSFRDHRGPGALFRMISTRAATAEQLGLPREVQALATEAEGLVLVAGPRGSGKSTLISAFVDLINRQRADYVITLERQLRLLHENRTALISQREVRGSADEMLAAARAALRENPDVLVVEDLNSAEMLSVVLDAAGQGLMVFASMTVPSAIDAVQHFVELAPAERRAAAHVTLAETFRGAVAQVLLRKAGGGRVAARELLLGTGSVCRLIAEGQLGELPLALDSGRQHGMVPLTDTLVGLVQSGAVDVREAYRKAGDRERLLAALQREGIDTAFVERLA